MSASYIHITRVFKPERGKVDQLKKLIKDMALLVEEHELDVLKYKFFATQDGVVISQEIFRNAKAAMDHMETEWYFQFNQKLSEDGIILKYPVETHIITPLAGYEPEYKSLQC